MRKRTLGALVAATLATATGAIGAAPAMAATPTVPKPAHIVVVVEENHSYSQVDTQPYLNTLVKSGANFTNAHGVAHPSEPNYLALWSGSTQGVSGDPCPVNLGTKPSLGAQINTVTYSESLPKAGSTVCTAGAYARKHNPAADFTYSSTAAHNQPFTAFPTDFNKLPPVALVVPNLNDDMHDGSVRTGDNWLKAHLSAYATWAKTHNSVLVVTFDEDNGTAANHILTVFNGQHVKAGNYSTSINHYNVLSTIESAFGLKKLGKAATAAPITNIWK